MTEDTAPTPPASPDGSSASDGKYMVVVAALLVLICATTAGLWILERRARVKVEEDYLALDQQMRTLRQMLAQGAIPGVGVQGRGVEPVRRERLAAQQMELGGQQRQVLLVPAELGRGLGFEVGDLALICPPVVPAGGPTTRPASGPAGPPG